VFSLEMSAEHLIMRLLGSQAKVDIKNLRTGILSSTDWTALMDAAPQLHDAPIYIDETPNISLMELRAKARRAVSKYNLRLLIVDYLQLITLNTRRENKQQEISEISGSLKALARELKIPILALSQLRRLANEDEKPQLSDLRESGAIEQDADVVIFIHSGAEETEKDTHVVDLIVSKQRNGPTGMVEALFLKKYTKFVNYQRNE
ncbi:MAG: DnaB-like helicase C-terminal domain-containing protein, partial [bacterium]|nr:DnaB-like helicase C-terminal domain-containing protein [bacterium]